MCITGPETTAASTASLLLSWNHGQNARIQRAAAVIMAHFQFPTSADRIHNKKANSLYIPMAVIVWIESAGAKSRSVYCCICKGRGSTRYADAIGEWCGHAPPAARYDPAAPFRRSTNHMMWLLQLPRISTTVTWFRWPSYVSSSDDQGEKIDCHTRNSSIQKDRYITNSGDMFIV